MQDWFTVALKFVRNVEGKYSNHSKDRGGETKYGISTPTFQEAKKSGIIPESYKSVKDLTEQDAKNIYKQMFWDRIKGDEIAQIDPKLAIALFDFYVNSGGYAVKELQKIIGANPDGSVGNETLGKIKEYCKKYGNEELLNKFLDARKDYYYRLVKASPDQKDFLNGWLNRVEKLRRELKSLNISKNLDDYYYSNACWSIPYHLNPNYNYEKTRSNLREATRRIDPLVIDLDGDGIELTDIKDSTAMFDLSGSGFANKVYNLTQRRVWI